MEKKDWELLRNLGNLSTLGFTLALSVVAGLAMGLGLDHWLKFTKPWGTIFFLLLRIVAGFWNVIKSILPKKKD